MLTPRDDLIYSSTKTYTHSVGLSCCFRQHHANSHCNLLHGYALEVKFTFTSAQLNERNWVCDFGSMKGLKKWLEDTFDHKTLIAEDDPLRIPLFRDMHVAGLIDPVIVPAVGCEAFAFMIYEQGELWLKAHDDTRDRVELESVEVREHAGNSAICRKRYDHDIREAAAATLHFHLQPNHVVERIGSVMQIANGGNPGE